MVAPTEESKREAILSNAPRPQTTPHRDQGPWPHATDNGRDQGPRPRAMLERGHGPWRKQIAEGPAPFEQGAYPRAMARAPGPAPWPWAVAEGCGRGPWPWVMANGTRPKAPRKRPDHGPRPSAMEEPVSGQNVEKVGGRNVHPNGGCKTTDPNKMQKK